MEPAILLDLWERSESATPAERGVEMMRYAGLDPSKVTLGGREAALLRLHSELFGSRLLCLTDCPDCRESMEIDFPVDALVSEAETVSTFSVSCEGWHVECRTLTAEDLADVSRYPDASSAASALLDRLVLSVTCDNALADLNTLPANIIGAITGALSEIDPLAEIGLDLRCPVCGFAFERVLDPPAVLWARLDAWARQLLREVHALARAYGWAESSILQMSAARRTAYLELIGT
jgi:hypothetical protein